MAFSEWGGTKTLWRESSPETIVAMNLADLPHADRRRDYGSNDGARYLRLSDERLRAVVGEI